MQIATQPITHSILAERVFNLYKLAHAHAATKTKKGKTDLCKAFMAQIQQDFLKMQFNLQAAALQSNCTPRPELVETLAISYSTHFANIILTAQLLDFFSGGFDFPLSDAPLKMRLKNGNFFFEVTEELKEVLQIAQLSKYNLNAAIDDSEFISAFYSSEITKFVSPANAPKNVKVSIYSIISDSSKESINFAYNALKCEILAIKELGYKKPLHFLK